MPRPVGISDPELLNHRRSEITQANSTKTVAEVRPIQLKCRPDGDVRAYLTIALWDWKPDAARA